MSGSGAKGGKISVLELSTMKMKADLELTFAGPIQWHPAKPLLLAITGDGIDARLQRIDVEMEIMTDTTLSDISFTAVPQFVLDGELVAILSRNGRRIVFADWEGTILLEHEYDTSESKSSSLFSPKLAASADGSTLFVEYSLDGANSRFFKALRITPPRPLTTDNILSIVELLGDRSATSDSEKTNPIDLADKFNKITQQNPWLSRATSLQLWEFHRIMADESSKRSLWSNAIIHYSRMLELADDYGGVTRGLRGAAYSNLKEYAKAKADYSAAVQANPENTYYMRQLGDINFNQGNFDEAVNSYSKALTITKDDPHATKWAAIASMWGERWTEAAKLFGALKQMESTSSNEKLSAIINEGICFLSLDAYEDFCANRILAFESCDVEKLTSWELFELLDFCVMADFRPILDDKLSRPSRIWCRSTNHLRAWRIPVIPGSF